MSTIVSHLRRLIIAIIVMNCYGSKKLVTLNRKCINRFSKQSISMCAQAEATPTTTGIAKKKRILSGVQPTGSLHLGNYLGKKNMRDFI